MSFKTMFLMFVIACAVYYQWEKPQSTGRFVQMPPMDVGGGDGVVILGPANCSSAGAQRADSLAKALEKRGIPHTRSNQMGMLSGERPSKEQMDKVKAVMGGEVPIVFIRGRAKANPSLDEVLSEYRSGSR